MKKIFSIFLIVSILLVGCISCSKSANDSTSQTKEVINSEEQEEKEWGSEEEKIEKKLEEKKKAEQTQENYVVIKETNEEKLDRIEEILIKAESQVLVREVPEAEFAENCQHKVKKITICNKDQKEKSYLIFETCEECGGIKLVGSVLKTDYQSNNEKIESKIREIFE